MINWKLVRILRSWLTRLHIVAVSSPTSFLSPLLPFFSTYQRFYTYFNPPLSIVLLNIPKVKVLLNLGYKRLFFPYFDLWRLACCSHLPKMHLKPQGFPEVDELLKRPNLFWFPLHLKLVVIHFIFAFCFTLTTITIATIIASAIITIILAVFF